LYGVFNEEIIKSYFRNGVFNVKIGYFTDSYKPYMSGVVKSIISFSTYLRERGHQVFIFAPDYPDIKEKDEENVYRFKSLPTFTGTNFRLAIPFTINLLADINKLDLDIIHTHSPFLMGWLGKTIARKYNIPLVFTYHTLYEKYAHYAPFAPQIIKEITIKHSKKYCSSCNLIITPSDYVQKQLKNKNIKTPMITIPTGVEVDKYKNNKKINIREKYKIKNREKVLLFVGRLGDEKNVDFLLRAVNEVINEIADIKLMLVGDGPQKKKLKRLTQKYNIEDRVIFTGWQEPDKVRYFYLAADLFVFPSLTETQGLVTLEAMAAGLPVVAVNEAGTGLMIDDGLNGILVKADEHLFAGAVMDLLLDKARYRLYAKNALDKGKKYSMKRMVEKLLKTYRGLLAGRAGYNKYLA